MSIELYIIVIISIVLFCIWQNNCIVISRFNYNNAKIPKQFDGFKIIHVSDLHNKSFGKKQEHLIKKIRKNSPDIIIITGDLIDRRRCNLDTAMVFIKSASEIAQIYFVPGNHEAWSNKYSKIKETLLNANVKVLDNDNFPLLKNSNKINIIGLSDPAFLTSNNIKSADISQIEKYLKNISNNFDFKMLLSHRPELFDLYAKNNIDLIFSGHAHGGQVRIPFIGGLVAPNQGVFPKYTSGEYKRDNTTMYVSRGLGNSIFPLRIFNRPELIIVTLTAE